MKIRKSKQFIVTLAVCAALGLAGCAQFEAAQQKATAWSNSTDGRVTLAAVSVAASLFAPQYAGVIGEAIYSLQTGTAPTPAAAAAAIGSVTGNHPTDAKVAALASAVVEAAAQAPSPNAGLGAAATAVGAAVK